jgi:hypothetical protein
MDAMQYLSRSLDRILSHDALIRNFVAPLALIFSVCLGLGAGLLFFMRQEQNNQQLSRSKSWPNGRSRPCRSGSVKTRSATRYGRRPRSTS